MTNFKLILYKIYTNRYKKYVLDIIMSLAYLSKSQMFYFMFYFGLSSLLVRDLGLMYLSMLGERTRTWISSEE